MDVTAMDQGRQTGMKAWALFLLCVLAACLLPLPAAAVSPPPGTVLTNLATATYTDANNNTVYINAVTGETFPLAASASVQTIISGGPLLELVKLESSNPVAIGGQLTYTIHYRNTGNIPATGVVITDVLSNHLVFLNASDNGTYTPDGAGGTVSWNTGTVAPGAGGAVTILSRVRTPDEYPVGDPDTIRDGTQIDNTVSIISGEAAADHESITTTVGSSVDLTLRKYSSAGTVEPGGRLTYTLTYKNEGNLRATNVRIRDQLPDSVAYIDGSLTRPGSLAGQVLTIDIGTMEPGAGSDASFQVTVTPTAADGFRIENTAVILSNEQGPVPSDTTVNTVAGMTTTPSLLFVKLDSPDPAYVGNPIVYTLVVANDGTAPLTDITVRDPIPAKTKFVSADGGGSCVNNAENICVEAVWQIETLAAGETKTLHLEVLVDSQAEAGTVIINSAIAIANEIPNPSPVAATTIAARTPAVIHFNDTAWRNKNVYDIGDTICLEVTDLDRNTDPGQVESVDIVLSHEASGDTENIALVESGANTGTFRGCIESVPGIATSQDSRLTVSEDSSITATYTDPLDASPVSQDAAFIDPYGIIFDSVTGAPVAGATATLQWDNGGSWVRAGTHPDWPVGQDDEIVTGADGAFQYPLVPPGTYRVTVVPGGSFAYPSQVPTASLPAGYVIAVGSRGESFQLNIGDPPLNFDIPVDPPPGQLNATKTGNKNEAAIGDIVVYTLNLRNNGPTLVHDLQLQDTLPAGIIYIQGSSRLDGNPISDPDPSDRSTLTWTLAELATGDAVELSYHCTISGAAAPGKARNSFIARGTSAGLGITSNQAEHTILVREGIFTSRSLIIGKVFLDANNDGAQTPDAGSHVTASSGQEEKGQLFIQELGISNVTLFLEDGTRVVTDRNGKFSIQGVLPGTHVLRLDESTLPAGYDVVPLGNRSMGAANSQFIDAAAGLIFKANFRVRKNESTGAGTPSPRQAGLPLMVRPLEVIETETDAAVPLEEQIMQMTPELEILSPADGTAVQRDQLNILVKGPKDGSISLQVNGTPVPPDRLGKTMVNDASRVQIAEFISVGLLPGTTNQITAILIDPFGNPRGTESISVQVPGKPATIDLKVERAEAPADGVSSVAFTARILDRNGMVLSYPHTVTVSASVGEFVEVDADPAASGHQVVCRQGIAAFNLRAPRETGPATITVIFDDLAAEAEIFFTPYLRDMVIVGLGDIAVGEKTDKRGAFFAKGEVAEGVLLTASYDSDKEDTDEFFNTNGKALETEAKYPILGDESKVGYEAQSQDKLYLKLEKDKSSLLYGDYTTGLDQTTLSAYSRTFNGLLANIDGGAYSLRAFGAHTSQTQMVDRLRGRGISGYYFLSRPPVVAGSEQVVIETRDRLRIEQVVSRKTKTRYSDYDIDYGSGGILFKEPIPSHDDDLNPVYIIVSYESDDDGAKHYSFGGRASVRPTKWLELGFTGISEEQETGDYTLFGSDITLLLPGNTRVTAEYAGTDALADEFDSLMPKTGSGWSFAVASNPIAPLSIEGYWRQTSDYFYNISATDAGRGMDSYGLKLSHVLDPLTTFSAKFQEEKDHLNDMRYSLLALGVEKTFTRATVGLEISHEEADDNFVPASEPTTRTPFDISEETPDDLTAAKISVKTSLRPDLTFKLSHKQDIRDNRHNLSQAGLDYQVNALNRLYIREEYGKFGDREEMRTAIGGETKVLKNTVAFNEYRLDNGADGSRNQEIIGLRNKFMLGKKITGNISLENQTTLSGQTRKDMADAYSIAGAVEYLPREKTKLTGRAEYRKETSGGNGDSILGEVGVVHALHPDYSLLIKERLYVDRRDADYRRTTSKTTFGIAYRPVADDRFNGIARLELKHDEETGTSGYRTDSYLFSTEGVYQYNPQTQLIGKYAGKYSLEEGFDAYTDLIAGRIIYDITDRFDASAEYRLFNSHATGSLSHGGAIELGYRVYTNLWFSVGYSFDAFDSDLTGDFQDEGFYLRLRFKFDENTVANQKKKLLTQE